MSDPLESCHLKLPYLSAAQAQKHVTHNEALRRLDSLVQLAVLSSSLSDPPVTPADGDRYIIAAGATGAWAGHDGDVASFVDGAWDFATPGAGWLAFDVVAGVLLARQATGWAAVSGGAPATVARLGINAAADDTNRLAVKSEAVLFSGVEAAGGGTGDVRFTINKETAGDSASLLFQSGWSGRAEVGLCGDDNFRFKVSPDGATWIEAIRIDRNTGAVSVRGAGALAGLRNKLINGDGRINQRAPATNADDTYGHDRHYVLTQTAAIAVSTLTAPADGIASMMRLTQSQVSAQRMGYAQILEAVQTYGLRGKLVTLGGKLRCSAAQAIRFVVLEWTGTADAVTSDVVNDWTSGAYTAGNFFLASNLVVRAVGSITPSANTITDWSLTATIGSTANNIIVFYWTEGTAAQNVTLDQRWYLVEGDATAEVTAGGDPFAPRHIVEEFLLCQRYFEVCSSSANYPFQPYLATSYGTSGACFYKFEVGKRVVPTMTVSSYPNANSGTALPSLQGCRFTGTAAGAAQALVGAGFTADAEL